MAPRAATELLTPEEVLRRYDGGPKTESDRRRWLEEAGFENIQRVPFPEGGSIIVAQKAP